MTDPISGVMLATEGGRERRAVNDDLGMVCKRSARAVLVVLYLLLLTFLTVVDMDGDPATTNLPSIVLICSTELEADVCVEHAAPYGPTMGGPDPISRLRRQLRRLLAVGQAFLPPLLTIRGP